jgi:hypothetical protein
MKTFPGSVSGNNVEIFLPSEIRVGPFQKKLQILRKAAHAIDDTEARSPVENRLSMREEPGSGEARQDMLLNELLQNILLVDHAFD